MRQRDLRSALINKQLCGLPVSFGLSFSAPAMNSPFPSRVMNAHILSAITFLGLALAVPLSAETPKGKPKPAAGKEPTREELAKLGGFEPAPDEPVLPANIQAELTIISVPKTDVLTLSAELKNPDTADAGYRELLAMLKKKTAKLVASPLVETKPGNRCVIESIREFRYAIEFSPIDPAKAIPAKKPDPVKVLPLEPPPAVGVTPTTFETRNVGVTVEMEPTLSPDGKTVDLQISAQLIELLGWDTISVEEKGELVQRIPQPRFHTNKVSTSMTVQVGQRVLAGVFEAPADPESNELFLLKITTRPQKRR
jgi:hypothetical protein